MCTAGTSFPIWFGSVGVHTLLGGERWGKGKGEWQEGSCKRVEIEGGESDGRGKWAKDSVEEVMYKYLKNPPKRSPSESVQ